jgi:hypothetical protein
MKFSSFTSHRGMIFAALLLALPVGCSKSGGSRFNGESNSSVNTPPVPSATPTVTTLNLLGGIDPVTGAVNDTVSPFAAPIQFSYVLADAENETLSLRVEFAREATPTTFQTATLINLVNPITNLLAINYTNAGNPLNVFTWDAATDLGSGTIALNEVVQFRVTPIDTANIGASTVVAGGITFAFPAPPNVPPSITSVATANAGPLSGQIAFNYTIADVDNDNLSLSMFFVGPPAVGGGPPPPPQPMTIIQVNGAPTTPIQGSPVNPTNPNVIPGLATVNYTGTFIWDSLSDIGISAFQDFTFVAQLTDGTDTAAPFTTPTASVGNPTAAFIQNLSVIGRSGNITLGMSVFDSDNDTCTLSFEVTFNGTDFIPMTLTAPSVGTATLNTVNGVVSSAAGSALSLTWTSTQDIPTGATAGMIRVTVVDDDRAVTIPTTLPSQPANPTAPPLPNLFIHSGSAGFPAGTLFFLSPTVTLAGPPVIANVSSDETLTNPYYAPALGGRTIVNVTGNAQFQIEGVNFGTDESLVTILINNLSQDVVEADSVFISGRLTARVASGLLQVIVSGVPSNTVPVLIRGDDYWEDTTPTDAVDQSALPSVSDPSVHGSFNDLDGDGDLDIVIAQDGANTILINQNFNEKISSFNPGPFLITATTNIFDLYLVKSAVSRNPGPYNVNQLDTLTIATVKQSTGPNPAVTVVNSSTSTQTSASLLPSGQSFVQTSAGYVAGLANLTASTANVGLGRHFTASILNRRRIEIFPVLPFQQLAVFEASTGAFPNRRPLGFSQNFRQSYGSTGTDLIVLAGTGPYSPGDIFTNGVTSAIAAQVIDNQNGTFNVDLLSARTFAVNQTIVNQTGTAGTIQSLTRNPTLALGGRTISVTLPTGSVTALSLAGMLNDAAITAGFDVPGQTVNLLVPTTAGFAVGTTVTNQLGSTGTVLEIVDGTFLRIRTTNGFNTNDSLMVNGAQVTAVTRTLETRTDFVARTSNNGLTLDLFSNDVLVVGNGTANQSVGFLSQSLTSLQQPDATGSYSFPAEFQNLTISVGDGVSPGNTSIVVPLTGTMTTDQIIAAINAAGLAARLGGNTAAGIFEASRKDQRSADSLVQSFIELRISAPDLSIHILDQGAQRVLGFTGRFVKPQARGLGNYSDESGARLAGQASDFSTKVEVFDADQDGDPDLLVSNALAQNRLLISDNTGVFVDRTTTLMPTLLDESFAVSAGDLDNDGDLDLAIANRGRNRILENRTGDPDPNNGNQPFTTGTMTERSFTVFGVNVESSLSKISSDVAIKDLDGDGRNDVVFGNLSRLGGTGPTLFFNSPITFAASTTNAPKFSKMSAVFKDDGIAAIVEVIRDSFLKQSGVQNKNFSIALGDINADGRVDVIVGNETEGTFNFQNAAFVQSPFTITLLPNNSTIRFFKNQTVFLTTDTGKQQGLTVREVVRDFPQPGEDTLVLDNVPNLALVSTVGAMVTANPVPSTRLINLIPAPDPTNGSLNFLRVIDTDTDPNPFNVGDLVQGNQRNTLATIIDIIPDPNNADFDLLQVPDNTQFNSGETLVEVPASGTVNRFGLTVFAARTQAPPYSHNVTSFSDFFQQLFDYPENFDVNTNVLDHRGSDRSKDVALGDLNTARVFGVRSPLMVGNLRVGSNVEVLDTGLVMGTGSALGGGGTVFSRFIVFANSEDRSDSIFDLGNLLFVINNSVGQKASVSDNGTPFLSTPFANNDIANERHHMPTDNVESFGVDIADIDNDGDLDILFLNGGGQGAGAQNLLYGAKFQPTNLDNFNAPYP